MVTLGVCSRAMHRYRIAVLGLSLLAIVATACSTSYGQRVEGASQQVEIAEALGEALAGPMSEHLLTAADDQTGYDGLGNTLAREIDDLSLPDGVELLRRGNGTTTGRADDGFVFISSAIAVTLVDGSGFCAVIGLGSDGQVVANAAPESVRPSNECRDAELLNLQASP